MIRIDLDEKLAQKGLKREEFLKDYWNKVDESKRNSFDAKYPGLSPFKGRNGLNALLNPKGLADSDPLSQWMKTMDNLLDDHQEQTLAQRLVCAETSKVSSLKLAWDHLKNSDPTGAANIEIFFKNILPYEKKSAAIAECFNRLDWAVCIYCGRNNLSQIVIKKEKGGWRTAVKAFQLDHFHDKATYPHLALSFFNLIPSCSFCNAILKGTETVGDISPWSSDYKFHESVTFRIPSDPAILKDEDDDTCQLKPRTMLFPEDGCSDYDDLIKVFKLKEVYQLHADQILALSRKRDEYSDEFIRDMADVHKGELTLEELKRRIFEPIFHKDTSDTRPLSKLSHDIHTEMGITPSETDDKIGL